MRGSFSFNFTQPKPHIPFISLQSYLQEIILLVSFRLHHNFLGLFLHLTFRPIFRFIFCSLVTFYFLRNYYFTFWTFYCGFLLFLKSWYFIVSFLFTFFHLGSGYFLPIELYCVVVRILEEKEKK